MLQEDFSCKLLPWSVNGGFAVLEYLPHNVLGKELLLGANYTYLRNRDLHGEGEAASWGLGLRQYYPVK
jgi:hypothetical protein